MAQRAQQGDSGGHPTWESMPPPIRDPFRALWVEVARLHVRWKLFHQLYVSGQRRVDLLNEMARGLFYQLQFIMFDDVVLATARLLDRDPATLSLHRLVDRVEQTRAHRIVPKLKTDLDQLVELADPLMNHRHKRIAHAEYDSHPVIVGSVLPGITPNLIDDVLLGIGALMNAVQVEIDGGTTAYSGVISSADGDSLIFALRKAAQWNDSAPSDPIARLEYRKGLDSGRYNDVDKSRDWFVESHAVASRRGSGDGTP